MAPIVGCHNNGYFGGMFSKMNIDKYFKIVLSKIRSSFAIKNELCEMIWSCILVITAIVSFKRLFSLLHFFFKICIVMIHLYDLIDFCLIDKFHSLTFQT
jgi:hypothetical protein